LIEEEAAAVEDGIGAVAAVVVVDVGRREAERSREESEWVGDEGTNDTCF
jgi:CYTH domain-containing protein